MASEPPEDGHVDFAQLQARLYTFACERGWGRYHCPKNLVMSLAIEVGELLECFQWLTDAQASKVKHHPAKLAHVRSELADVLIYLIHLADALDVDLLAAVRDKIEVNKHRYPPTVSE